MPDNPDRSPHAPQQSGVPFVHTLGFWFSFIALVSCVAVGSLTYAMRASGLRQLMYDQLASVRDSKCREIEQWFQERKEDIVMWAEAPGIQELAKEHAEGRPLTGLEVRVRQLEHMRTAYHCHAISIVDPESGRTIAGTQAGDSRHDQLPPSILERLAREKAALHTDVFVCPVHQRPTLVFATPVRDSGARDRITAYLAFYMDLSAWFYPCILQTEQIGQTGEVLLVNAQGIAQSPLRRVANAPAASKLSAEPAKRATAGQVGTLEEKDYYSVPVLAAHGFIPAVGWGIVVKQDQDEIFAPIRRMAMQIVVTTGGALALASLVSLMIARRMASPAAEIARVSDRIRAGDLAVRAEPAGPREMQTIARNFNGMMDQLATQFRTGETLGRIFASAGAHNRLGRLVDEVLPKLMEATRSQVGVFYLANDVGEAFDCLTAYGLPRDSLAQRIHVDPPDHLLARAAVQGQIQVVDGLSEKHELTIPTQSGTSRPVALMSVPLMHSGKAIAVIGLGSLYAYRAEDVEIGRTLSLSLGQSVAAADANEKNLRMSEELRVNNEELGAANEELQSQTEELQQQSEELHQQTEELAQQRAAVEEADRLKSQFLSNMSHELRTPLNSIMALSQLMLARGTGTSPEKESEYLRIIERNGRHLLNLINDILDLSKIEAGRLELSPTLFRPEQVVRRALDVARPLADAKNLALEFHPEPVPAIQSDEDKVHQILLNLLSNAVKFTDQGKVVVRVRSAADGVIFVVEDTGIGIAESEVLKIFDEFRQVDGSTTRRHEGTGLGLAIGQKLAHLLGGEIAVRTRPGHGSTFTLTLPLRLPGAGPTVPLPSAGESRPGRSGPSKTVLVVDDDPSVRNLLRAYLTDSGYQVLTASNGREALAVARKSLPGAITLDILMPDMDGWEVIRELKAESSTASIPILVISVSEDRATALALGASGFLLKPVDRNILTRELDRLARRREIRHILVVDDDAATRQHLSLMLEETYARVSLASGGSEALELVRTSPPDAIVLDLMMPDMDGFTVLDRLRSEPATRDIPVLILTAKDLSNHERDRLRQAVSQIVTKGTMDRDRLLQELEQTLASLDSPGDTGQDGEPPTVLVVDDDEIAAIQISSALEDAGYRTTIARSGAEALDRLRDQVADAVVLDIMMPGMDGFEVLRQFRSAPQTADLPVLILTAKEVTAEERARLAGARVRQLIQKGSVDRDRLVRVVREMLVPGVSETAPPQQPARHNPDGLILVVEDNPDNLITIGAVLDDLGRRHAHAADGEQAVRLIRELKPALVLMDMQLPVLSGMDAVRRIKADPQLADIPIVALTAKAMRGDREVILAAGCQDYLAKPLDRAELARMLEKWAS